MSKWRLLLVPSLLLALVGGQVIAQDEDSEDRLSRQDRMRERMMRDDNAPKVGDVAPVLTLQSLDGKSETNIAGFRGKKPVLLFFGSYT